MADNTAFPAEGGCDCKSVRYRVRLGPYGDPGELNRTKSDLSKRGVEVAVIKY